MKLYNTEFEEQETIVHIDYARSQIHLYSCRKTVIRKLKEKKYRDIDKKYII